MHHFCLLKKSFFEKVFQVLESHERDLKVFFGYNTRGMCNSSFIKILSVSNPFFNFSSYFFGSFSAILRFLTSKKCSIKVTKQLYGDNKTIYLRYILQINKPGILENINTFTQATERGRKFVGSKRVGSPLMKTQFKVE